MQHPHLLWQDMLGPLRSGWLSCRWSGRKRNGGADESMRLEMDGTLDDGAGGLGLHLQDERAIHKAYFK